MSIKGSLGVARSSYPFQSQEVIKAGLEHAGTPRPLGPFGGWKAQALFVEECRLEIKKQSQRGERWKVQSAKILRE